MDHTKINALNFDLSLKMGSRSWGHVIHRQNAACLLKYDGA